MSEARPQQVTPVPANNRTLPKKGRPAESPEGKSQRGINSDRDLGREARNVSIEEARGVPTRPSDPVKRAVDVLFSLIGLVLTVPVWIVISLAIKLEDGGAIFYRDRRLGKGGNEFDVLKFRSMVEGNGMPNVKGHPPEEYITAVGRIIRPTALDELPQLINILRGEMSLVGPRAAPPEEQAEDFEGRSRPLHDVAGFAERHAIRPGLTGLAQTLVARDVSYRTKFRYDCFYIENRTLTLDLMLIIHSVMVSLAGKWPEIEQGERKLLS